MASRDTIKVQTAPNQVSGPAQHTAAWRLSHRPGLLLSLSDLLAPPGLRLIAACRVNRMSSELACVYAVLALHDDGVEITVSATGGCYAQRMSCGVERQPKTAACRLQAAAQAVALHASPQPLLLSARAGQRVVRRGAARRRAAWSMPVRPPPPPHAACLPAAAVVQPENIVTLTKAAGIEVEPYWPGLFAKLVEKKGVDEFIVNVGAGERGKGRGGPGKPRGARPAGFASHAWLAGRLDDCSRLLKLDQSCTPLVAGTGTRAACWPAPHHLQPAPLLRLAGGGAPAAAAAPAAGGAAAAAEEKKEEKVEEEEDEVRAERGARGS